MSLLLGQYGSLERQDFVQPSLHSGGPNIVAKGSYLQPGPYASVSVDDRSRFRNTAFVPPVSIELMTGFMDYGFYSTNNNLSMPAIMPQTTYLHQQPQQVRRGYTFTSVSQPPPTALMSVAPYGQVVNGPVSAGNCPATQGFVNASGACELLPTSPLYQADARNVYF